MKRLLLILGIITLIALAAAGGFYGGVRYQTNKVSQVQANFERERGQFPTGQFPGGAAGFPSDDGQAPAQAGGMGGTGGIAGQVKTIEGEVLTVSTSDNVTTVNLSDDTQIQKSTLVTMKTSDLQPGMQVMVIGQKDTDGIVSARQVMILTDTPTNKPYPSPEETEP
jgi:hypothetical protein